MGIFLFALSLFSGVGTWHYASAAKHEKNPIEKQQLWDKWARALMTLATSSPMFLRSIIAGSL